MSIADFMLTKRGEGSMITGSSTHNQRIERLWRDVFEGVLCYFYHLFYHMEDEGILDPLNFIHIVALHYIFMDEINRRLQFWQNAWSGHRIRSVKSSSHHLLLTYGQLDNYKIPLAYPCPKQTYRIMDSKGMWILLTQRKAIDLFLNL